MNDSAYGEHQGTGGERAEAGGHHQPAAGTHRDHDKHDFKAFEQHRLERRDSSHPLKVLLPALRLPIELCGFGGKDGFFIM